MSTFVGIVVGYDGSSPSDTAVDWAAREAARRELPLRIVCAVDLRGAIPSPHDIGAGWAVTGAQEAARDLLDEAALRARKAGADLEVETALAIGGAAATLVAASETAALVVVGNRGHGGVAGALLGSVAFALTAHSVSPVVVVHDGAEHRLGPEHAVVVGLDGSAAAGAALDEAAEIAEHTGTRLRLVTAWDLPGTVWAGVAALPAAYEEELSAARAAATEVLGAGVERARVNHPGVEVEVAAVRGRPVDVLRREAASAALVVVGSRGRGGFRSLLMGSVSRGVVQVAACPALVVHHRSLELHAES